MPGLTLYPPDARHPTWRVRGKYLGVHVDRSTGTGEKKVAAQLLAKWKQDIERGAYARPDDPTFASAALSYMQAGGETRFLAPVLEHFGTRLLHTIRQEDIDGAAVALYPAGNAATRNRQVYTPVSSVLRHAGVTIALRRPKGAAGTPRLFWFSTDEAFALLRSAHDINPRFSAMCVLLLYTGARLGDALKMQPRDVELGRSFAFIGKTKNGKPRAVHLPPVVVAALANITFGERTVFGWGKGGNIYEMLDRAARMAGVTIPDGVAFHAFRHTYGAWMRRHAGLDTSGLVGTGAWLSHSAARVYEHVETSEEARKADLLPAPNPGGIREMAVSKAKS